MMIDNAILQAAIGAAALIVFYAIISRGLFLVTEPLRQQALDLAVELSSSDEVGDMDKYAIRMTLEEFHSSWEAWAIALRSVRIVLLSPFTRGIELELPAGAVPMSHETRAKLLSYQSYWLIVTVANSPAAALLFAVTTLIASAFSMTGQLMAMLLKGHGSGHGGSNGHVRA